MSLKIIWFIIKSFSNKKIASLLKTDFIILVKPSSRPFKRMGVVLVNDNLQTPIEEIIKKAKEAAGMITVN